ncbi:hypothetical protein VCR20J5_670025 [Vibrio crassostreae]|nr:hypothetical protein VCR15J5_40104 [Vibrio crassostreae]CDT56110.1 hypothetical protein VCR20J5_670025 [Vibrio crassostreae]
MFQRKHWLIERIEVEMGKWNGVQVWSRVVLYLLVWCFI